MLHPPPPPSEEWDWPPPKRRLEGRIKSDKIELTRPYDRIAPRVAWGPGPFLRLMLLLCKAVVGAILGVLAFACLWLLSALVGA